MNFFEENRLLATRRQLLTSAGTGLGAAALSSMLNSANTQASDGATASAVAANSLGGLPDLPHIHPRIKNVIYLFQNGAPTHVDLFDHKPLLSKLHGQPIPSGFVDGKRFSTMTGNASGKLMLAPVEPFHQHGQCGATVSEFMPHTAGIVDKLCFVKGMHTESVNHAPAITFLLTGSEIPGRPTLGAWLNYGLGNEADDLPAFVVMTSISKWTSCGQIFYDFYWGSGFLPSK